MADQTITETTRIVGGIEWFRIPGEESDDCQCARCGSSCAFASCWNCRDGEVERDLWDGCGEPYFVTCEWCNGAGGGWHCISGPEWCDAHPLPNRDHIATTALTPEAWRDDA
jgi:hypothetical protein